MTSLKSRLKTAVATLSIMGGAGGMFWFGAEAAANFIESRSAEEVRAALDEAGQDWVQVTADGLIVRLTGTAPSEIARFRAATRAATVVDASRVVDEMTVASIEAMTPPDFKIEMLRNDQGISLIGLVPAATDRSALIRSLRADTAAPQVTDLLESADYPVPENWDDAMVFGLEAVAISSKSKVSITPDAVHVAALADSLADKTRIEAALARSVPSGITLTTEILAPRPVIAPFLTRFVIDETGPHFDGCAADDEAAREMILAAARAAGASDGACTLGLGAPSTQWGEATAASIDALAAIGSGSVTLADDTITLVAPASVAPDHFEATVSALETALPSDFTLLSTLERPDDAPAALKFQARLVDDGTLTLRGAIADERMREAVDSFARSRFEVAQSRLRANPEAPGGWTLRLIAALESLGQLQTGHVEVTPELVRVAGVSGIADATDRIAAILAERLGPGARYELSIRYDRWLDAELGLPDGEECVASLNRIMSEAEIGFEPARASIAGDPEPTLAALSEVMVDCADYQIEAGGHTDSQGSEAFNADLSRSRAQAILAAMREAGIDTGNMTARGYGESQPIATNETEEGREANRRIEFRLLSPRPVRADALPEPVVLSGITGKAAEIKSPDPHNAGPNNTGSQIIGPQIKSSGNGFRAPGPLRPEIFDNGIAGPFGPQMHTTELLGPPLPPETGGGGASVRMLGASEDFETLDEREENIRVPVLTPDASTPRPVPRPVTSPDPDDTLPDENPDE